MKANEFVKTHGIKAAQDIVKHYGNHTHVTNDARMFTTEEFYKRTRADYVDDLNSMVKMTDLKRLVESHELVKSCGCLEDAKSHLDGIRFNIATKTWFGRALLNWSMYADKLEKAIAEVESCQ